MTKPGFDYDLYYKYNLIKRNKPKYTNADENEKYFLYLLSPLKGYSLCYMDKLFWIHDNIEKFEYLVSDESFLYKKEKDYLIFNINDIDDILSLNINQLEMLVEVSGI